MIFFWSIPVYIMSTQKDSIKYDSSDLSEHKVAIVFGAGVRNDGTPMSILEDRLSTAADLYEEDKVDIIFVSGDNRFDHYNEPEAMKRYLVEEKEIPEKDIVMDFAGRRTYDTCVRANKLWNINRAILVTQEYHLYRSTLLCESAGMKVTGIDAAKREYQGNFIYKSRELFALHKAVIDLYIKEPDYVGGEFEEDLGDLHFEP
jgi:vancomycin permeability regulator SanA